MTCSSAYHAIGVSLFMVASVAWSQQSNESTIHRHTSMGTEVLIRAHAEWNSACMTHEPPGITITEAPEHGRIDLRPGDAPLGSNYVGDTNCEGRVGRGIQVIYLPNAAFRGSDGVTYEVHYHKGSVRTIHVEISVD